MTREELEQAFGPTRAGVIVAPGKFEGEPIYVPYFWDLVLDGNSNDTIDDDGNLYSEILISREDRERFPEIPEGSKIVLWEDSNGFVHHSVE